MRNTYKKIITFIVLCVFVFSYNVSAFAAGYNRNNIDDYVGQVIADLKNCTYKKDNRQTYNPYSKRYYSMDEQCVGYVVARMEEKLKTSGIPDKGSTGEPAKDIPSRYARYYEGKTVTSYMTGIEYTIHAYQHDNGEQLVANCWASFNTGGKWGHVVFVEEVIKKNSDTYVYYTEGGTSGVGQLKREKLPDFLKLYKGYVGCVTFTKQHSHSYDSSGYCTQCGVEYPISISLISPATYYTIKDDVPVRDRPYSPDTILNSLSKGAEVTVIGSGKNSAGNLWYKLSDEKWIYSNNLTKKNPIPACTSHSYNSYGYCEKCNVEYPISITSIVPTTYYAIKDDVPVRARPYSSDTILKSLSKGTAVTVVGSGKNSIGNLWYKLSDENWIYSNNLTEENPVKVVKSLPVEEVIVQPSAPVAPHVREVPAYMANGLYSIRLQSTNESFDVTDYGTAKGTNLQLQPYSQNTAQIFRIENVNNVVRIWSVCSPNLVVDIGGNDTSKRRPGVNIDLWTLNVDYSKSYWMDQEWSLTSVGNGSYLIRALQYPGLVAGAVGSNVELVSDSAPDSAKLWIIEPVHYSPEPSTSIDGAEVAVKWAREQIGSHRWDYYCLAFVFNAYKEAGIAKSSFEYAKLAEDAFRTNTDREPPYGALVFYEWKGTIDGEYKNWGHMGIHIGNNKVIHAFGKQGVQISHGLDIAGCKYTGWGVWR